MTERERESERAREQESERERDRESERESERKSDREREIEREREKESENELYCSLTSYLMAIMFGKMIKCQNVDLEIEGQDQGVEERDLRHSAGSARIHIVYFFRILATWEHPLTQTGYTQRETEVIVIGKIFKADLPKHNYFGTTL